MHTPQMMHRACAKKTCARAYTRTQRGAGIALSVLRKRALKFMWMAKESTCEDRY